ncbi:MAG: cytochrome c biogenesis protein [Bacteroidetes bacterium]|nr:cytochrome c biogenesis protein [Bacteroidota bacterium]
MKYKIILGVVFTIVITAGLSMPMVPLPQNWYELPVVPGLEEKARIIFFHVPTAWVAVIAFLSSFFYGILYLSKRRIDYDIKSVSAAGLGFMFCILATVTGAIWAKFSWGAFWNWDPSQTSIFVLLLIYGAYFALRSSIEVEEKRASLSAVYSIIAGITVPFFIFIMPRIVASLHPDPIINPQAKIHMNPTMLVIFLTSLASFTGIYYWMFKLKVRITRLDHQQQLNEEN